MLPDRQSGRRRDGENMNKYAEIAIPEAVRLLEVKGGSRVFMSAKIAGGACMFDLARDGNLDIGRRNVEAVREILRQQGIPLEGEDTGGSRGRSVEFLLDSGDLRVRTVLGREQTI